MPSKSTSIGYHYTGDHTGGPDVTDFPYVPPGKDMQGRIARIAWENKLHLWKREIGLSSDSDPEFTEMSARHWKQEESSSEEEWKETSDATTMEPGKGLQKAMYGLKGAPSEWRTKVNRVQQEQMSKGTSKGGVNEPQRTGLQQCWFCGMDPPDHLGKDCPARQA